MKRKAIVLLLILMLLVTSCSGKPEKAPTTSGETKPAEGTSGETEKETEGDSDLYADVQEVTTLYSGEVTTLNYLVTATTNEFSLAANLIDSLIDYDKYGVPQPALATEWTTSEDGLVWTFKLREDVKWVNAAGEEVATVKADDFVQSAKYILTAENESSTSDLIVGILKNAQGYYDKTVTDFNEVGVKALDDYTLEYTLEAPTPYFLSMLTYVCFFPVNGDFLEEKGDAFGTDKENLLYNGAYVLSEYEPESKRTLAKNELYWDKDNVHITKLNYIYNKEAATLAPEMYARGEITQASIPANLLDQWMNDPSKKDLVRPSRNGFYSYWYAFDFAPTFDAEYEPENWVNAVSNKNFRKALFHALDRKSALLTDDPYNPEALMINTVTPPNFVDAQGVDYVDLAPLKSFTDNDSFDKEKALEYKEKAMKELEGKVNFPVKILTSYNPSYPNWTNRVQVVKQQMEGLLGTDFIEFVIVAGPSTGFLSAVRRDAKYALLECNWGPDYLDPYTYTEPFAEGNNYGFNDQIDIFKQDGKLIYDEMVKEANAITDDLTKRYEKFAEAEAYLIEEAIVIPYSVGSDGYMGSYLNPFEAGYSPFGVAEFRYKGQHVYKKPMNAEEFKEANETWEKEREAALKEYSQKN